jgi:hypothetical protein
LLTLIFERVPALQAGADAIEGLPGGTSGLAQRGHHSAQRPHGGIERNTPQDAPSPLCGAGVMCENAKASRMARALNPK